MKYFGFIDVNRTVGPSLAKSSASKYLSTNRLLKDSVSQVKTKEVYSPANQDAFYVRNKNKQKRYFNKYMNGIEIYFHIFF